MFQKMKACFRPESDYRPFLAAVFAMSLAYGLYKGVIDNYLAEIVTMTEFDRGIAEFARTFRLLSLRKLKLFPGVPAMLETLHRHGKQVFLLSNAQALFTRPELTLLGLDTRLDGSILSSEAGRKKPDPEFYHILMEKYGLDPQQTVMVGNDDIADCHGAAKAGLDSFYVQTQQSPVPTGPLPDSCTRLEKIFDLVHTL